MNKSALLVIDAQQLYTTPGSEMAVAGAKKIIRNINSLIERFETTGDPIVYVRHTHKTDGSDSGRMWDFAGSAEEIGFVEGTTDVALDADLHVVKGAKHIVKHRYSSFQGTDLLRILQQKKVDRVVITGFMTNFCCEATARHAHDLDFYVDFIVDATGCPDLENLNQADIKKATCETLAVGYANILTTAQYLKKTAKGL